MPPKPPAPPRFSITTGWPSRLDILSVTTRLMTSAGPPAGNGTMKRIGRVENSWASKIAGHSSSVARLNKRTILDIRISSLAGSTADPCRLFCGCHAAVTPAGYQVPARKTNKLCYWVFKGLDIRRQYRDGNVLRSKAQRPQPAAQSLDRAG